MLIRLVAAALVLLAAPALSQPPRTDQEAIEFAQSRGRLLYAIDRAAWVATDDMQEKMPGWQSAGMAGFVVDRDGPGWQVLFFGGPDAAPVAFYRARVANHRVVSSQVFAGDARPALTPIQRRLVAARAAAGRAAPGRRPCANAPFNVAMIPPETPDGPIDVYLMTPQLRAGEFPFGGHYRLTVAADGSVSGERAFTNSCLTMSAPPRGNRQPEAMFVTHLLDPVPTEIHVFTSLTAGLPVFVGIAEPERIYSVVGDRIRAVQMRGRGRGRR